MIYIIKEELKDLILDGISTEELNSKYDYSRITNMSGMFYDCKSLETIPLLDTSQVKYMNSMFSGCKSLREIPFLDTSNVTNMNAMFSGCESLETIDPDLFPLYDFSEVKSNKLRKKYPEIYI